MFLKMTRRLLLATASICVFAVFSALADATHPRLRDAWRFGIILVMNETSEQIPETALRPIARDTSDFVDLWKD